MEFYYAAHKVDQMSKSDVSQMEDRKSSNVQIDGQNWVYVYRQKANRNI